MLYRCSETVRDTGARALGVERSIKASETWTAPEPWMSKGMAAASDIRHALSPRGGNGVQCLLQRSIACCVGGYMQSSFALLRMSTRSGRPQAASALL